jgi:hypothetical protein
MSGAVASFSLSYWCVDLAFLTSVLSLFLILSLSQAGYPPFWNEDVEKLFLSIVHGNYSFHHPYWSKVSDDVKDLIRRMVRSDKFWIHWIVLDSEWYS